ncbi:ImmA/IrrE family metallo-endopeptidase [Bifidobacterium pseudocatenulatum]|uniref:ImmA/IrrE family metallo-endopeptidase n=1 Tax=Bifidobacterium pseudocatenulatum TaxID=28026 RepID=UPI001F3AE85F|nr:ImmA/IrrE family metallo-endopeptidase [Bifidobacterium pseudocatenulatum]UIY46309.1 ImmA/IrrE family metallo-endopeptidase [Bifidobacterium pseudocatenulatum]
MERLGRITTSLPDLPIDRRMTYGAMRRAIVGLPVTVSSALLPDGLWGCYDAATEVILIDRRLTYTAKRCTLVHELLHWQHGDTGCANDHSKQERRARRETASLLIDPVELALLERMYDDPWSIADELNVTIQVLTDYRQILAERNIQ